MTMCYQQAWSKCLQIIKKEINEQSFQTWFNPIVAKKFENNTLTIQVPNKFFYEWIEEHYIQILKKAITTVIGKKSKLEYLILVDQVNSSNKNIGESIDLRRKPKQNNFIQNLNCENNSNLIIFRESPFIEKYQFENFVEGSCNRIVKSAAATIAQNPGITSFNPFIIYGGVGIGKTHIAQAIGNHMKSCNKNKKIAYVPSELFASQYVHAVRENNTHAFSDKFMDADLLIVDDIQFLAGKEKTQETFFHIFNHLHQNGKQLVMTSDTAPNTINGLQDRLLSRFKWGLTTELQNPDIDTRVSIITKRAIDTNINISEEIINYIASFSNTNIRELEGILNSISAHASINRRTIDLDLTKQVINSIVKNVQTDNLSLDHLLNVVAQHYKVDAKSIQGASRSKDINFARKIAMYIAKSYTEHTLKSIGLFFGKRHHSTVLYSIQSVNEMLATDKSFKKNCCSLMTKLGICEPTALLQ